MNATVARIVDLLFEDIEESEEVRSIHDEVMNNCQDRYSDLIRSGYGEDEAIGAVVESLKGMDEVLREYPRKTAEADPFSKDGGAAPAEGTVSVDWDSVRNLRVAVRGADVTVEEADGPASLTLEHGRYTWLDARVEGDTLVITQEDRDGDAPLETGRSGGFFGALSRWFGSAVHAIDDSDCRAFLAVPAGILRQIRIQTLRSDITLSVCAETIEMQNTSGDCRVDLTGRKTADGVDCRRLDITGTSGDIGICGRFGTAHLKTISGDIDFRGAADRLEMSTVSGDIDADSLSARVEGSTVSGDLDLTLTGVAEGEVQLQTVSGDVDLSVPDAGAGIAAGVKTRSGDVGYSGVTLLDDAPLKVKVSTVSGDVEIRG